MSLESSETSVPNRRRTRKRTTASTDAAAEQTLEKEVTSAPVKSASSKSASKASVADKAPATEKEEVVAKPRASRRTRVAKPARDEEFGELLDFGSEESSKSKKEEPAAAQEEKRPAKARRRVQRQEELDLSFDDFEESDSTPKSSSAPPVESRREPREVITPQPTARKEELSSWSSDRDLADVSFDEPAKPSDQQDYRSRGGGNFQRRRDRQQGDRGERGGQNFQQGGGFQQGGSSQQGGGGGRRDRFRYQNRERGPDRGGDRFQNDRGGSGGSNGGYRSRDRQQKPGHQGGGQQGGNFNKNRKQPAKANYTARISSSTGPVVEINGTFTGVLELHPKGYGFLRDPSVDYGSQEHDPFVSSSLVEKHKLREGIMITGHVGPGSRNQGPRLHEIFTIDGREIEEYEQLKHFDELTAINPFEQIKLETGPSPLTMRVMDLLTPIGKGQRALIVAPPRTGKTMLLQDIANSVSTNHPEVHLIVLLIDERPEEVTEMRRLVRGEVIASSMDRDIESHVRTSQLIIERGKRIAEAGGDAFILLDSITRTARAFNKWVGNTGRTMTGGLDVKAMDIPKKMFGQARRFDEGGSLTIVGTALIQTGSQMDEVIFQEFKGTGNMEMVLSRDLADRRIWPAIDVSKSGTRREEKILDRETLEGITMLRRSLVSLNPVEAMEQLTTTLSRFPSNKEFLQKIKAVL